MPLLEVMLSCVIWSGALLAWLTEDDASCVVSHQWIPVFLACEPCPG